MGGIMNANDALEFIIAGAAAVQVGTASFIDPDAAVKVANGLEEYSNKHSVSMKDLKGSLKLA